MRIFDSLGYKYKGDKVYVCCVCKHDTRLLGDDGMHNCAARKVSQSHIG